MPSINLPRILTTALTAALLLIASPGDRQPLADDFFTIGTGGVTGIYYPSGGAICHLVNRGRDRHGLRCAVESTGGSVDNLELLHAGELDFAIVQSDWQHFAYHGLVHFEEQGRWEGLRSVFALHAEPFTVVARADSGIEAFEDLQGKRVNVGNPGSGHRATLELLMERKGWSIDDFRTATEVRAADMPQALCDDEFDAFVYMVGHPSDAIREATRSCDAYLVSIASEEVDDLVAGTPFFRYATIPGGMYEGTPDDVRTWGVGATLVTTSDVSDSLVGEVVRAVFTEFDRFRGMHEALAILEKENMVRGGLSASQHRSARQYFEEVGLLKPR